MRIYEGTLCRFDSVTEIVASCRDLYSTDEVRCVSKRNGEFMLRVSPAEGKEFESLVVHFEGERTYAVLLPDLPVTPEAGSSGQEPESATGKRRRPWWRFRK